MGDVLPNLIFLAVIPLMATIFLWFTAWAENRFVRERQPVPTRERTPRR